MRSRICEQPVLIALFVAIAMAFSLLGFNSYALADPVANSIYSCTNGWKLYFEYSSAGVTITGVNASGNGTLVVPDKMGSQKVIGFADACFKDNLELTSITLPSTIENLGRECFQGSGLKSIVLPASIKYIPAYCFKNCKDLSSIEIKASEMSYISINAMESCVSLTSLQIPPLTGYVPYSDKGNIARDFPLGTNCFWNCENLKSIEFLGSVGDSIEYFSDATCVRGCSNLEAIVYHTRKSTIPNGMSSTDAVTDAFYFSLDFYKTEQDAENGINRVGSATYSWNTKISDILSGKADAANAWMGQSQIPVPPAGKVWGLTEYAIKAPSTTLADSYKVVPCDPADVKYGYVCSPVIQNFLETRTTGTMNSQSYPAYYLDSKGDALLLEEISAFDSTGKELDSSRYDLIYEKGLYVNKVWEWSETTLPLKEPGTYRVHAQGKGAYAASATDTVTFTLQYFAPGLSFYNGDSIKYLGTTSADAMSQSATECLYSVIVPEDDWRYQLIGAGVAGIGNANMLFDGGRNWNSETVRAFIQSKASSIQIIGSTSKIPESDSPAKEAYLVDLLKERDLRYATRYSDDSTIQALARSVYVTIRDQHLGSDVWGAGWSSTAVIVPAAFDADVLPIAQLAYMAGAPVFFTEADGSLDPKTLKYLISDGFEKVYVAGDESLIPSRTVALIKDLAFIQPERVLYSSQSTSGESCIAFADVVNEFRGSAPSGVIVASTDRDSNVAAAAQLASLTNSALLTCSSQADSKLIQAKIQDWVAKNGFLSITKVQYIGDFSDIDGTLSTRISSIWNSPMSTLPDINDTREVGDYIYKLSSNGTANLVRLRNRTLGAVNVENVVYGGRSYIVTAVSSIDGPNVKTVTLGSNVSAVSAGAFSKSSVQTITVKSATLAMLQGGAFRNIASLSSLTLTSKTLKTLPANSFSGCANLKTLKLTLSSLTKIAANAFSGCSGLQTLKLSAAKLTKLPSNCFKGATNLTSIGLTAAKLKTIASKALYGCKKLKSFTICKNVTYIGTYAFQGCTALTKLTIPSKVKTIKSSAFKGAKKLKTLTVKTKKITKKSVKKSLKGSSIKTVKVSVATKSATNKKYRAKYKKYFTKANCGRKVSVK